MNIPSFLQRSLIRLVNYNYFSLCYILDSVGEMRQIIWNAVMYNWEYFMYVIIVSLQFWIQSKGINFCIVNKYV
jgi:hypothetical protein